MLEFKPLKTFGRMRGPPCVQHYKFSHELTVFPGPTTPPVPHIFYLQGAVPRSRSAPHSVLNSCHLLSLGTIQVLSQRTIMLLLPLWGSMSQITRPRSLAQGEYILHRIWREREIIRSQTITVKQLCKCNWIVYFYMEIDFHSRRQIVHLSKGFRKSWVVQKSPQLHFLLPLFPFTLVLCGKDTTGSEILPISTNMTSWTSQEAERKPLKIDHVTHWGSGRYCTFLNLNVPLGLGSWLRGEKCLSPKHEDRIWVLRTRVKPGMETFLYNA